MTLAYLLAAGIVLVTSLLLFGFGANLLFLSWRSARLPPRCAPAALLGEVPEVCLQIPIYNERYVAARVIASAAGLDWPRDRLRIQVLDDSDDDTVAVIADSVAGWARSGVRIDHIRRRSRQGYKAGALAAGLSLSEEALVAVLDADFIVPRDFLQRLVPEFADPEVGFVQARWGHLNDGYSLHTRLQSISIDFHFMVEQAARSGAGMLTNFTGTAGIWRRRAIEDAGGWSAATLTEDLDLSYRAQLRGWRAVFREDVEVAEELPVSMDAYRRQQARWATGSFQCAARLLGRVLRSPLRPGVRLQAAVHLLAYGVGPLMLLQLCCYPVLIAFRPPLPLASVVAAAGLGLNLISFAPWIGFAVAQHRLGRRWTRWPPAGLCQVLGAGLSLTVLRSLGRALRGGGVFERTPKYRIDGLGGEWRDATYARAGLGAPLGELTVGLAATGVGLWAAASSQWLIAAYSAIFAAGLLWVGVLSIIQAVQVVTARRLGRSVLGRLQGIAGPALLFAGAAAILAWAASQPLAFEDSYHHWLIAANLAGSGRLADPLFAMEDSWLPGYHLVAAAVLRISGLHNLGALRAVDCALALITLACVHALAGGGRRGRLAVTLLALNPIFILTATASVAEPLMIALLGLGALALDRGRRAAGALAVALACGTGTKAWLLAGAALAVDAGLRLRQPKRLIRLAWAVPALALALALQASGGFAAHSAARGAAEAHSAGLRGSLPASGLLRALEFAGRLAQACAPLAILAPLGAAVAARTARDRRLLATVAAPSALYLVAVTALVGAGVYSGSHRYYYPVLPAAALLAAAALERCGAPVRRLAVAAAVLTAVAYLPVMSSLAADNAGLAAAGGLTRGVPGRLLTDSPVVAYFSGRSPADIAGSRLLPPQRQEAVAWLRQRGVGVVVLEDIDYYRATSVFPELAHGMAAPPFVPLGDAAALSVPGGKPLHAYTLSLPAYSAPLFGSVALSIDPARQPSQGKTATLQKGLCLVDGGVPLTGEGVGFGVPAAHYPDGWRYSRTATTADLSGAGGTIFKKTFELDMAGGDRPSDYRFVPAASRGRIEVTYRVDGGRIGILVRVLRLDPGFDQIAILNEQSSGFDDFAEPGITRIGSAFGSWAAVGGPWARLRSGAAGVEWSQPAIAGAVLYAGREAEPGYLDWSGLDYLYGPAGFEAAGYTITAGRAR